MSRADLMSLTETDLADLVTRGALNRAKREVESGNLHWTIEERGSVTVRWSDGVTTWIPANQPLANGQCDCPATGRCRHLVRLVLAYQLHHADSDTHPIEPWSPGDIADAQLTALAPRLMTRARALWDAGIVAEVTRSTKPVARFHGLRHTVRFLVPGDLAYARCDCPEETPCSHAVLAVWAFRRAPEDAHAAIVDTMPDAPLPARLLDEAEATLLAIASDGLADAPRTLADRLDAVQHKLRRANLRWPALVLADIRQAYDRYHAHDSRFAPEDLTQLFGEFAIRADALRAPTLPIPRLFVAGSEHDRDAELAQTRMVGLGCSVRTTRHSIEMTALLQDHSTGVIAAVSHNFPAGDADFSVLAQRLVLHNRDLHSLGAGQLVVNRGTLASDHRLTFGRSDATVYTQQYRWEELLAPVLAETFADVRARLANLPPASLRPRRHGEDFHVVPVVRVENARFEQREHALRATLVDAAGGTVQLHHPFETRNRNGTRRALQWLTTRTDDLRFVAGRFRRGSDSLVVSPTALVFETTKGRVLVQPWVDDMDATLEHATVPLNTPGPAQPLDRFLAELATAVGDELIRGSHMLHEVRWRALRGTACELGLTSIASAVDELLRGTTPNPLELAILSTLAGELR